MLFTQKHLLFILALQKDLMADGPKGSDETDGPKGSDEPEDP